jgi:hypothetical protein
MFGGHIEGFICSKQMDQYPRFVKLTRGGGIEYVSNTKPLNAVQVDCKNHYMNEYDNTSNGASCWI